MAKAGRPQEVHVGLTVQDAVNILNTVVYGTTLRLNGGNAKTKDGHAVGITFSSK